MAAILQLGGGWRRFDQFTQMHLGDLLHYLAQRDPEWVAAVRTLAEDRARTITTPQSGRPPGRPPAA